MQDTRMKICGQDVVVSGRFLRIARLDGEKFTSPVDPAKTVDAIRFAGVDVDLFTFLQRPPETTPRYPYFVEMDNFAVMPVTTFDYWWTAQIQSLARNRARQAEKKGVVIREVPFNDELLDGIVSIHNETPIRQGRRFPHYGMTIEGARTYAGTFLERSIFIGAFLNERLIGFLKMVIEEHHGHASVIHILSLISERDKAPTNALIAQAVKSCAARSIPYLMYENFVYGKKQSDGLTRFKEVNGFQRMDLPRYYLPLSRIGQYALRLGAHRRFVDYCPEVIAAKLRSLRTAWYTYTLRLSPRDS